MRNCFVPGCDSYCKAHNCTQRKMFFAPKEMFEKWKEKLVNKREFKKNDRVCERHFESDQIIEYWENKINGIIHRTKREKPRLTSTALPTLNLPSLNEMHVLKKKEYDILKAIKPQVTKKQASDESPNKKEQQPPNKKLKVDLSNKKQTVEIRMLIPKTPTKIIPNKPENDEENVELFENLYDEVHDVTLPNTLYGINRCPDRNFIVFNKFDVETMGFSKYLFIDPTLSCKVYINGNVTTTKLAKNNCNTEFISEWLDKINDM